MKKSSLINQYGGIDESDIQVRVVYEDDRWLFYVEVPSIDFKMCAETFDIKDAVKNVAQSCMEHMHWHLEEINEKE